MIQHKMIPLSKNAVIICSAGSGIVGVGKELPIQKKKKKQNKTVFPYSINQVPTEKTSL